MENEISPNEEKEIEKAVGFLTLYKRLIVISTQDISSMQLQKLRSTLLPHNVVVRKLKNFITRQAIQRMNRRDLELVVPYVKHQIAIIGIPDTFDDLFQVIEYVNNAQQKFLPPPGSTANHNIVIDTNSTYIGSSAANFFQALGIPMTISGNRIYFKNEYVVVPKGQKIEQSFHKVLSMFGVKPCICTPEIKFILFDGKLLDKKNVEINEITKKGAENLLRLCYGLLDMPYLTSASIKEYLYNKES